jgi:hypothetical protein
VKQIRKRITYANVMSSIAVFLVLGGGAAYAAKKIGSNEIKGNSITTGKIKKEAVSASKIKKNAVTTAKIANGAVTGAKLNLGTVGTVPNATHANTADNANTVGGQSAVKIFKTLTEGQSNVPVASVAGFNITATCETNDADVRITSPSGPGAVLNVGGVGAEVTHKTEATFDYRSTKPGETGDVELDQFVEGGDSTYGTSGVTLATSSGTTVSGQIGYDYDTFNNTPPNTCIVYGHLLAG